MRNYKSLFLGFLFVSAGAHAQDITTLLCQGSGSVLETRVSNGMEYDEKAHSYKKMTSTSTTDHRAFSGTINVEISSNTVRMKLPHELIPLLNKAQDGWLTLENTFVGDKEITGVLHLNALNKPKVRIDRVTGQLSLSSGLEDFNGNCNKVDFNSGPKF
ncbi:MAG: hypothetical protein ABS939_20720 [Psychrobacillus sp.]